MEIDQKAPMLKEETKRMKEEMKADLNVKLEIEEKMEVDEKDSAFIKQENVRLYVDGIVDNEIEETVIMTPDEIRFYLQQKISEYIKDPEINPILSVRNRTLELQEEIKDKTDEIAKLNKAFDLMYRNQEKFFRHMGIFPKVPTNTVAVSVDLPHLPNSIPPVSPAISRDQDLLKNKGSEGKVLNTPGLKPASTDKTKQAPKPSTSISIECIDLTEDSTPAPPKAPPTNVTKLPPSAFASLTMIKHPAPLPPKPFSAPNKNLPHVPPKPRLKISAEDRGIVLQWDMPPNVPPNPVYGKLSSFDIFGYQEQKNVSITTLLWKKIGSVKAMNLPMACTLTQFLDGNKYHFAVRAVDIYSRCGGYSDPISIVYKQVKPSPPKV